MTRKTTLIKFKNDFFQTQFFSEYNTVSSTNFKLNIII